MGAPNDGPAAHGCSSDAFFTSHDISTILLSRSRPARVSPRACLSRRQLEHALERIDQAIPRLLGDHAVAASFWSELSGVLSKYIGRTGADDYEWMVQRLKAVLAIHGVTMR